MVRIRYALIGTVVILSMLWALADDVLMAEYEFFAWRTALINYTGIVGMGAMSITMLLAVRPVRLEAVLGGLDKIYRLHKWLGIVALIFLVGHFLLANIPKLMVEAGTLTPPERQPPADLDNVILQFFLDQRGLAEEFGDWGFKIALVLIVIALVKWFPYRFFFRTHRLLSIVYLFLVFHSFALMEFGYWTQAIGPLMVLLMAGGVAAAAISLSGRIGAQRRVVGEVERLQFNEENRVLKIMVRLRERWPGHEEGQFAFVTFDRSEGAHPFSIASAWQEDGKVAFFVKELGDYTATLPETLHVGDLVTVEGPYGRFGFESGKAQQIWIAGGIGIVPFASRLKALIDAPGKQPIDLFYSASSPANEQFLERIQSASEQAGIKLHLIRPDTDSRLDADKICEAVPEWKEAAFWFCGPSSFGDALRKDLLAAGLPSEDFHQELFEMR